jgi:hypothetical protein
LNRHALDGSDTAAQLSWRFYLRWCEQLADVS